MKRKFILMGYASLVIRAESEVIGLGGGGGASYIDRLPQYNSDWLDLMRPFRGLLSRGGISPKEKGAVT